MRNGHDTERCRAAERHAKAAAVPSTVGISKRPGGAGRGGAGRGRGAGGGGGGQRGGVMPKKRLRSESGHHRLEACGPFNVPHKLA